MRPAKFNTQECRHKRSEPTTTALDAFSEGVISDLVDWGRFQFEALAAAREGLKDHVRASSARLRHICRKR